jgi:hypothetical protein
MASLARALFVSALATGALAFVLKKTSKPTFPPPLRDVPIPPARPAQPTVVETDELTDDQREALLSELGDQY